MKWQSRCRTEICIVPGSQTTDYIILQYFLLQIKLPLMQLPLTLCLVDARFMCCTLGHFLYCLMYGKVGMTIPRHSLCM